MTEIPFDCCLKDGKEGIHEGDFKRICDKGNKITKSKKFESTQYNKLFSLTGKWYMI